MRQLCLGSAVIIHLPDFFVSAARADEIDLALSDAVDSAAQAKDDLIGEAVRLQACIRG